jgi:dTDP-4-amino-4,6-dideoxygalactose transaminase
MPEAGYGVSNCWLTCLTIDPKKANFTPEDIRLALEQENIESRPLWKPMHMQPVFKRYPSFANGVSKKLFQTGLCLPSGTAMSKNDLERIKYFIFKALKI